MQKNWSNPPLIALLIANVVPILGALFLGWDASAVILLYWAENIVIGFYNILKILFLKVPNPFFFIVIKLFFVIPLFTLIFGGATALQGGCVLAIYNIDFSLPQGTPQGDPCRFDFPLSVYIAFACLFISHGISFVYNFFYKGERTRSTLSKQVQQPFERIGVLLITIFLGMILNFALGSPIGALLILVLLKIYLDVKLHLRERKKNQ